MGSLGDGKGRRSKVVRLIDKYGLDGIGDELEANWTARDPDERRSLRDLADDFNQRVLQVALTEAGVQPIDGEVENIYRLLTDDGVSSADRTRAVRRLQRDGIDVDDLQSDFVSYQAIRTYLIDHRDAEYSTESVQLESVRDRIQRLRSRTETVAQSQLEQLGTADELDVGSLRTTASIQVLCEECGTQFDAATLLERGACHCPSE